MMPISDDNSDRVVMPYVNLALIALNVLLFVFVQDLGRNNDFTFAWSTVPAEIVTGRDVVTSAQTVEDPISRQTFVIPGLGPTPYSVYLTLLASMFMHGSLMHLLGNMLYLWIFGDNIEDRLGHGRYLLFYLVVGILASLSHVLSTYALGSDPMIPSLGASGAISGVQGAYLLLYPHRRVRMIIFRTVADVKAYVAVGLWFVFQLINGAGLLGGGGEGIAYAAHIGGFVAGFLLIRAFAIGRPESAGPGLRPRSAGGYGR